MSLSKVVGRVFHVGHSQGWYSPDNAFTYDQYQQDIERLAPDVIGFAKNADVDENGERAATIEVGPLLVRGRVFDDGEHVHEVVEVFVMAGEQRDGVWMNGNEPWREFDT